jgi:diadenosine tetraphosphate (Ap4A) HIT family hydrolase
LQGQSSGRIVSFSTSNASIAKADFVKKEIPVDCLFCSIQEISNPSNPEDEIIDESENFYAKAALGHFVFGYTLIVSKEHLPSFAYVPEHLFLELEAFQGNVLDKLHSICQHPIAIMEHGAINRCQRGGSCIDHAHLHLMPLAADLYPALSERFPFAELESIRELRRFKDAQSCYLYYQREGLRSHGVQLSQDVPSQLLRRIACGVLGMPDLWDWRNQPLREPLQQFKNEYKRVEVAASIDKNKTAPASLQQFLRGA